MTLALKMTILRLMRKIWHERKKRHEEASTQSISIFLRGRDLHSPHLSWPRPMQLNQSKKGWNPSEACNRGRA